MPKRFVRSAEYGQIVFMSLKSVDTTYPIVEDTAHTERRQLARTSHATRLNGGRSSKIARTKRLGGRQATSIPPAMPTKYAPVDRRRVWYRRASLWDTRVDA